jgi:hypothetical protein
MTKRTVNFLFGFLFFWIMLDLACYLCSGDGSETSPWKSSWDFSSAFLIVCRWILLRFIFWPFLVFDHIQYGYTDTQIGLRKEPEGCLRSLSRIISKDILKHSSIWGPELHNTKLSLDIPATLAVWNRPLSSKSSQTIMHRGVDKQGCSSHVKTKFVRMFRGNTFTFLWITETYLNNSFMILKV